MATLHLKKKVSQRQKKRDAKEYLYQNRVFADMKPLEIGIHKEILSKYEGQYPWTITNAIKFHTIRKKYLRSLAKGGLRYNLNGEKSGEVTDIQVLRATKMLKTRIDKDSKKA